MRGKAKSILHHKVSPVSGCERSNGLGQPCFEAPIPCHTWPHALGFPIRDTTLLPIAPGRVLVNSAWVSRLPDFFKDWEVLTPPPSCLSNSHPLYFTSRWISVNVIMLDAHHVLVEESEKPLMEAFKSWNIEPIPIPFKHFQTFGGSFHCATLDVRRGSKTASSQ